MCITCCVRTIDMVPCQETHLVITVAPLGLRFACTCPYGPCFPLPCFCLLYSSSSDLVVTPMIVPVVMHHCCKSVRIAERGAIFIMTLRLVPVVSCRIPQQPWGLCAFTGSQPLLSGSVDTPFHFETMDDQAPRKHYLESPDAITLKRPNEKEKRTVCAMEGTN